MGQSGTQPISHEDYDKLIAYLEKKNPPVVPPQQRPEEMFRRLSYKELGRTVGI